MTRPGLTPNLPVPVLLGTEVPELADLLQSGVEGQPGPPKALLVSTWAQKRRADAEAAIQAVRELRSTAQPNPVENQETSKEEEISLRGSHKPRIQAKKWPRSLHVPSSPIIQTRPRRDQTGTSTRRIPGHRTSS